MVPKFIENVAARYSMIGDEKYLSDEPVSTSSGSDDGHVHWDFRRTYSSRPWWILGILWIASIVLAVFATVLVTTKNQARDPLGTLASGFTSDFAPAREAARGMRRTFTGSPLFTKERGEFVPDGSPSLKYMGATPEIDQAWQDLERDRYFLLSDEEARETWGEDYTEFWHDDAGGYLGGLDVFHTLHCLDHLRRGLYPDTYHEGTGGGMHQIHCIDHLRQLVQCNADLTVNPSRYYESIHQNYIDSDRTHTCRDFTKVREWASGRVWGEQAVKSRYRNGTVWEDNIMLQHIT
ncbi:hypothetical protein F5B18DRAFT_70236 [Nemania serpens]|nr:hypothetical protein F5B18DRAFT_70236 [Nemania serpens]